jgi:hypothetical protein
MSSLILSHPNAPRRYCFGDVHGELVGLQRNLRKAKLIDRKGNWATKKLTTVIQMGDVIDRGPKSVESYYYLEKLQDQANETTCGKVIRLIGNHELMFLQDNFGLADFTGSLALAKKIKEDVINYRVQAAYFDGTYIYIHGGLRSEIKEHLIHEIEQLRPATPVTPQDIVNHINTLLVHAVQTDNFTHPIFCASLARQGDQKIGGVFWTDFSELENSLHAKDQPQIVAHLPPQSNQPAIRSADPIWCVDAGLCQCYGGRQAFLKIKSDGALRVYERVRNIGIWKFSIWEFWKKEKLVGLSREAN